MTQQKNINVDLSKLKNESCACGGKFWEISHVIKMVPGLMIGQSQATMAPVQVYRCEKCKSVHPNLLPAIAEPEEKKLISS